MEIESIKHSVITGGYRLSTTLDGEAVTVFVVATEPDLDLIADIVPQDVFESGAQVHANVIGAADDIENKLLEVVENMNPSDAAVFLCENDTVVDAVMDALAVPLDES